MPVQILFSAFLVISTVSENRKIACIMLDRCLSEVQLKKQQYWHEFEISAMLYFACNLICFVVRKKTPVSLVFFVCSNLTSANGCCENIGYLVFTSDLF